MEETVISHPTEPFGEYMLQNQMDKVFHVKGSEPYLFGFVFDILEGHLPVFVGYNIFFTDYAPI